MNYQATFESFFNQAGDIARATTLAYFRKSIPVDDKQDKSPVTQADREIEEKLRDLIHQTFPSHGIIGEEFGRENDTAEFVWAIDPIDGTKSFATGRPLFGTVLGLLHNGKPTVGLIDQAYTQERWFGIANQGAWHNGAPIRIAPSRTLENARLYTGAIGMFDDANINNWMNLCRAAKWTQYSCDCYAYGLLAMGWCDLLVEQQLKIYDIAGAAPIITGAGGVITDWQGRDIDIHFIDKCIASTSPKLARQALDILQAKD